MHSFIQHHVFSLPMEKIALLPPRMSREHRKVKSLAQGHTGRKWDSNLSNPPAEPGLMALNHTVLLVLPVQVTDTWTQGRPVLRRRSWANQSLLQLDWEQWAQGPGGEAELHCGVERAE